MPLPANPNFVLSASRAGVGSVVFTQDTVTSADMVADVGAAGTGATVLPRGGSPVIRAIIMA